MKEYNIKDRLFYDGYDIKEEELNNIQYIDEFFKRVQTIIFNNQGHITLIPYFDGKIEGDCGISGIILGKGFHFTCHTFSRKGTVFIDYYGNDEKKNKLLDLIRNTFKTDNYDLGSKETQGNFGKHIILTVKPIIFDDAMKRTELILKRIGMTPISEPLNQNVDENEFDILQPIAESHISLHQHDELLTIDVFSCKYFDTEKLIDIFDDYIEIEEVNRGLQYK